MVGAVLRGSSRSRVVGGRLGLEWLQANPHLAVGAQATLRSYSNLLRTNYNDAPLGLIGALTLRYAF